MSVPACVSLKIVLISNLAYVYSPAVLKQEEPREKLSLTPKKPFNCI